MDDRLLSVSLTACAVTLITGCATAPGVVELNSRNTKIEPVYRVEQPAGTAAGQYAVGRMYLAEGRVDAAITRFRNALTLQPGYVEALNGLGVAYGQKGRYEEAAEAFRTALAAAPDAAHLLNNLGFAQFKAGHLQEASVSLDRALRLEPHNTRTRENVRQLAEARERAAREPAVAAVPASAAVPQLPVAAPVQVALTMKPDEPVAAPQVAAVVPVQVTMRALAPTQAVAAAPAPMQDRPAPVVEAATAAVPAPGAEPARSASFEVVLAKSSDSVLVQVAPAVYEIRPISAAQQVASGPATVPVSAVGKLKPAPAQTSLAAIDRLEVSNGAGTSRLATRTARRLARMGAEVTHVTNYRSFGQQRTEIQYRDGHAENAKKLGERLPVDAKLVSVEGLRGDVDVRLVVGRDMATSDVAAWWNETLDVARAAASEPVAVAPEAAAVVTPESVTQADPAVIVVPTAAELSMMADSVARADAEDGWRHL